MGRRERTPGYIIFYILFLPDTWQALIGIAAAYLLAPAVIAPDMGISAKVMVYIMLAVIGYAGSTIPGRWITGMLKKLILGNKQPR